MGKASASTPTKISSFLLMIIFVTLTISLIVLIVAINALITQQEGFGAEYLLLMGLLGVGVSTYLMFQTRRRILSLRIEVPQITTTIECRKCGFKNVREFQRGDYIFKEVDPCQKCNEKMLITAIYREVKEKERERFPF